MELLIPRPMSVLDIGYSNKNIITDMQAAFLRTAQIAYDRKMKHEFTVKIVCMPDKDDEVKINHFYEITEKVPKTCGACSSDVIDNVVMVNKPSLTVESVQLSLELGQPQEEIGYSEAEEA